MLYLVAPNRMYFTQQAQYYGMNKFDICAQTFVANSSTQMYCNLSISSINRIQLTNLALVSSILHNFDFIYID